VILAVLRHDDLFVAKDRPEAESDCGEKQTLVYAIEQQGKRPVFDDLRYSVQKDHQDHHDPYRRRMPNSCYVITVFSHDAPAGWMLESSLLPIKRE
jgi:hypothetical protein